MYRIILKQEEGEKKMRLFVALEPSPDFRQALAALQSRLQDVGVTGRYLDPSNLHLTLAFIGMWSEDISMYLPSVQSSFPITLSHLGVFPEAKILWAGVAPSEALNGLAENVRRRLSDAGVPFDRKEFNPHITLARKPVIPEGVHLSGIEVPPASMTVRDVCLYRSDHTERGMAYTVIGRGGSR